MDPKCLVPHPYDLQPQATSPIAYPSRIEEKDEDELTLPKAQLIPPHHTHITLASQPPLTMPKSPLHAEEASEGAKKTEQVQSKPSHFVLIPVALSRSKAGDSDQPQSDSADEHRRDLPETLQRIFANAQRGESKEPQMEEHRLERFRLACFDDDQHEYGEDEEYIEDETLNVLCSPLLCNSQELCLPPPLHHPSHQQPEEEGEQEGREGLESGERGVLGEGEGDVCNGG